MPSIKEKIAKMKREWRLNNRDKVLAQKKRYRIKHRKELCFKQKEYYAKNKSWLLPIMNNYGKEYRLNNREKDLERKRIYRLLNKDKIKRYRELCRSNRLFKNKVNTREKNRIMNDIQYAMKRRLRHRTYLAFRDYTKKGKIKKSDEYGINYKAIVEKLFREMPYDFSEKKYHIDHIIPLCSFDLTKLEQIKYAFCPQNHRWLLAQDNLIKIKEDLKLRRIVK